MIPYTKTKSQLKNPSKIDSVLVTGCAGFIGSNFVKKFKEINPKTSIIGIDDFSTGRRSAIGKEIIFYEGSILDKELLEKIFTKHKPKYVFHFAAIPRVSYSVENPTETTNVNIVGTVNLLNISKKHKIKRFIFSSSSSVYGEAKNMPTDENETINPKSPYAMQKYAGEGFCKVFSDLFDLETVCLRYFNVFGPGQYGDSAYSTVVSAWLESLYFPKNKKSFIEGDGKQSRDFCYVDNIVNANICAMKINKKMSGEIFNIANGDRTNLIKVHKLIEKYTNKKLILEKRKRRLGDIMHTEANISKAQKILKYKPTHNFESGLIETVEWFKKRLQNNDN